MRDGCLGVGEYDAVIYRPLGGKGVIADVTPLLGDFGFDRELNNTSKANMRLKGEYGCVTMPGGLWPGYDCVLFRRNHIPVWKGVITDLQYSPQDDDGFTTLDVDAADWSDAWDRSILSEKKEHAQVELTTIFLDYVKWAYRYGYLTDVQYQVSPLGRVGDRLVNASDLKKVRSELDELANTGVDWTFVLDRLYVGGFTVGGQSVVSRHVLSETDFLDLKLRKTANELATRVFVRGNNEIRGQYGSFGPGGILYETVIDEQNTIRDQATADLAARTKWDRVHLPLPYVDGGNVLSPDTPVLLEDLIPGVEFRNIFMWGDERFDEVLRLESVKVSVNDEGTEEVNVTLQPHGTASIVSEGAAATDE